MGIKDLSGWRNVGAMGIIGRPFHAIATILPWRSPPLAAPDISGPDPNEACQFPQTRRAGYSRPPPREGQTSRRAPCARQPKPRGGATYRRLHPRDEDCYVTKEKTKPNQEGNAECKTETP